MRCPATRFRATARSRPRARPRARAWCCRTRGVRTSLRGTPFLPRARRRGAAVSGSSADDGSVRASRLRRVIEYAADRGDQAIELLTLGSELFAAGRSQRVKARAAIVFRRAPFALHPAFEQQALQRGIQRALADLQDVFGEHAQALRDAVAMLLAAGERLQDQQVERAGQEIERRIASHRLSMGASQKGGRRVNNPPTLSRAVAGPGPLVDP